ncbi:SixA phosphatase family protein [Thalassovita sp.]|uniref:SixA phosphatase family protein n=1 Tax=Thalassovita sp. TaxID=1979401 RepID=UPI002AB2BE14|nr:histidine phosphatase family protein [Thalassovita sp.]
MSLKLILMRHAKSDWNDPLQSDHERGLNPRGQASAKALGDWLRGNGYLPDLLLSSDATRTRETWAGLVLEAEERFLRGLYLAPSIAMLEVLKQAGDAATVLMLGHNPGIADFADTLAAGHPGDADFDRYPTCATTVYQFEADSWSEVGPGMGQILNFTIPRRLT